MDRRSKQKFFQGRHVDDQQAHEKMLSITNHQGNANQNHNEISLHIWENWLSSKKTTNNKTGENKWQSTPVLLPGKSHGQRSLAGYSPWGRKESDTTERLHFTHCALLVGFINWYSHYGKQYGPQKIKTRTIIQSSNFNLGYLSKENKNIISESYMHLSVYFSIICSSQDMEVT